MNHTDLGGGEFKNQKMASELGVVKMWASSEMMNFKFYPLQ